MDRRMIAKVALVSAVSVVLTLAIIVGAAYAGNIFTVDQDGALRLVVTDAGKVGIGTTDPKTKLHVTGLPEYTDNAAAIAAGLRLAEVASATQAGLTLGAFYRTGDILKVVH